MIYLYIFRVKIGKKVMIQYRKNKLSITVKNVGMMAQIKKDINTQETEIIRFQVNSVYTDVRT